MRMRDIINSISNRRLQGLDKLSKDQKLNLLADICILTHAELYEPYSEVPVSIDNTSSEGAFRYFVTQVFSSYSDRPMNSCFDTIEEELPNKSPEEQDQIRQIFQSYGVSI